MNLTGGNVTDLDGTLAWNAGSHGGATISGGSWGSSNNLYVGSLGTGTLDLTGGSITDSRGFVGVYAGSHGAATVSAGTWSSSISLTVGFTTTGTLDVTGGSVTDVSGYLGYNAGSNGTGTISGGTWSHSGFFYVGYSGTGNLYLSGGTTSDFAGVLGFNPGSNGVATISDGTWSNGSYFYLGYSGTGRLDLSGTGVLEVGSGAGALTIARDAGSSGTLNLGTGSLAGTLTAGSVSGGSGTATVNFNHTGDLVLHASLLGTLLVKQAGPGTTILNGHNNYAGATLVTTGTLQLDGTTGGTFTTSGSFQVAADSLAQLTNGITIVGGRLADAGSAIHSLSATLDGTAGAVTNNGSLILDLGSSTTLMGTLTNNGTVTFVSGNYVDLTLAGDVTVGGTGTTTLVSSNFNRIFSAASGDRLTIGAGQTVQGAGNIGLSRTNITNNGTLLANQPSGPLILQPGAGGLTNNPTGVLRATGGGTLLLDGSAFTNNGLFDVQTGSTITIPAGALTNFSGSTLTGGTYKVTSTGSPATLDMGGGSITTSAANIRLSGANTIFAEIDALANNEGSFEIRDGRDFATIGDFANSGTITVGTGSTLTFNGNVNGLGALFIGDGGTVVLGGSAMPFFALASQTVPEPSALAVLLGSMGMLAGFRRFGRKNNA